MNEATSLFDARRRPYEASSRAFMQAVNEGRYPPIDALCQLQDALISTPADALADAAYKLEISIGDVDEVGGETASLDQWAEYRDPEGNVSSSPNSFMTLRKHWNRMFGIKSVKDLDGDPERSLLYALANVRAAKAIRNGVAGLMLRAEIRQATYAEFEKAKTL